MATEEYVDAGHAVDFRTLSDVAGEAPAVAKGLNFDRILKAREAEPHNWITYYGAYDGKRYSPLDQINVDNVKSLIPAWVFQAGSSGMHSGASTYAFEAAPLVVDGVMYITGWDGWLWASTPGTGRSCGATSTRPRTTCRCAAATSTAGALSRRAWCSWSLSTPTSSRSTPRPALRSGTRCTAMCEPVRARPWRPSS